MEETMRIEARLEGLPINPCAARYVDGVQVYRCGEDTYLLIEEIGHAELTLGQAARAILGVH